MRFRILVYLARLHLGALLGPPVWLHILAMGVPVDLDFVNAVSAASLLLAGSARLFSNELARVSVVAAPVLLLAHCTAVSPPAPVSCLC